MLIIDDKRREKRGGKEEKRRKRGLSAAGDGRRISPAAVRDSTEAKTEQKMAGMSRFAEKKVKRNREWKDSR